jgi:hypothetical protein
LKRPNCSPERSDRTKPPPSAPCASTASGLDFQLKRLAYLARNGKLDGVRLEDGELIVTPLRSDVPPQAE